jgi:hypothetical protein
MINMKWILLVLILSIPIIAIALIAGHNQQITGQAIAKTSLCLSVNGLPDADCTPGAIDTNITQDNIQSTICVSGYTTTVRPPTKYTNALKTQQIKDYGYTDTNLSNYEEDHLISLELGGSPQDPKNLWPEPYNILNGARVKDRLENLLHVMVCNGSITLTEAQQEIATDWYLYYNSYGLG